MTDENLTVAFGATTGEAEAGAERVTSSLRDVGKEVERAEELFKYLGERMLEVFALHEITEFVSKMSELGEQALRSSAMLGMTVEQVQELAYAAKLAGTDSESFNQSMVRFERNIAEAQKGAGNAAEAFHNLGISQEELKTSTPNELLNKVADAFHNTADGAEKVETAIALGGRSWAQMIPFLDRGSAAIKQAGEELDKTSSKMTKEQAEALEATHQGLVQLEASWRGVGLAVMDVAGPAIDLAINALTAAATVLSDTIHILKELQVVLGADLVIAIGRFVEAAQNTWTEVSTIAGNLIIRWQEVGAVMTAVATGQLRLVADIMAEADAQIKANTTAGVTALHAHEQAYEALKTGAIAALNQITAKQKELDAQNAKPKLPALSGQYGKGKQDNTDRQLALEDIHFQEQMGKLELANRKSILDQKVALGEISKQEEFAQLKKLSDDEYNLDWKAIVDATQLDGLTVVEKQKLYDQLALLHQKHLNEKAALDRKAIDDEKKQYDQLFQGINRAFSGSISGIIQGTQTWQQATAHIFTSILASFADMAEQMVTKWLEAQLMSAIFGKATGEGDISTNAAVAGSAAFASTAAIPIIGPELAPAAAAAAYAQTMAFSGLLPLETGAWEIPGTMPALLHPGEMVVPQTFAQSLRDSGTLGGGGTTITIHAVDAQSVANLLKSNRDVITGIVSNATRNFSPNVPAWKAA